jgi:aminoglycoside phosphotransferase (APT) family kinase protein
MQQTPGNAAADVGSDDVLSPRRLAHCISAIAAELKCARASPTDIRPMAGNSGLSFGFSLESSPGETKRFVSRHTPPGVVGRNADVMRQVPLLKELRAHGVPVPAVEWAGDSSSVFGTATMIVDFVDALPLHFWRAEGSATWSDRGYESMVLDAVDVLAKIHQLPWKTGLCDWDRGASPSSELDRWQRGLAASHDQAAIEQGNAVADRLSYSIPSDSRIGLFHGDFQTNNVLYYADGRLATVVDWELAGIGPQLLDVAWLQMMLDPSCWADDFAAMIRIPVDPDVIAARYKQHIGDVPTPWWRAFACWRFGCIVAYNAKLHRTGKRIDELYEILHHSIPALFDKADILLHERQ